MLVTFSRWLPPTCPACTLPLSFCPTIAAARVMYCTELCTLVAASFTWRTLATAWGSWRICLPKQQLLRVLHLCSYQTYNSSCYQTLETTAFTVTAPFLFQTFICCFPWSRSCYFPPFKVIVESHLFPWRHWPNPLELEEDTVTKFKYA